MEDAFLDKLPFRINYIYQWFQKYSGILLRDSYWKIVDQSGGKTTYEQFGWFSIPLAETSILVVSFIKIIPVIGQITNQKNLMDNSFPSYEQIMNLRDQAKEMRQQTGSKIFLGFDNTIYTSIEKDERFFIGGPNGLIHVLDANFQEGNTLSRFAKYQILHYLEGKRKDLTFPIIHINTQFNKSVLEIEFHIPYGETRS